MFKESDRYIFGAYFNMGLHNAFIIMKEIANKLHLEPPNEENELPDFIVKIMEEKDKPEIKQKAMELFEKNFRFLKPMTDFWKKDEKFKGDISEKYFECIKDILEDLNNCRNYYTHTQHKEFEIKTYIKGLEKAFESAMYIVKDRFGYTQNDIEHIWMWDNKGKKKKGYHYDFFDSSGKRLSEKGIEFLACLFLEKKFVFLFLKQFRGFKSSRTKRDKATLESYSVYSLKLPKDRIETGNDKISLAMDMLNELQKCPGTLFNHLSQEEKDKFRIEREGDIEVEDELNNEILLKRKTNRFPMFSLKYIDLNEIFTQLRFHIDLGTYNFDFYNKTSVDGNTRLRILNKRLKGFGRLNEITDAKNEQWKELIRKKEAYEADDENTSPYITDTISHYHIVNNEIGLKNCEETGMFLPEINGRRTKLEQPDYILSIYELPALIFYHYLYSLNKQTSKTTESVILDYKEELIKNFEQNAMRFFDDVKNEAIKPGHDKIKLTNILNEKYGLDLKIIPKNIRNYLLGDSLLQLENYASRKITTMIDETNKLLKQFGNKQERITDKKNKPGIKGYAEIKSGELAKFLAKDMMKFRKPPESEKDHNANSQDFQVLQASLAQFAGYRDKLNDIFRKMGLTNSENAHPFLKKIGDVSKTNIADFYIKYLEKRKEYLEKCLDDKEFDNYHYLKPKKEKWLDKSEDYVKKLTDRYKQLPMNLPRGLFQKEIIEWLKDNQNISKGFYSKLSKITSRMNTVFLIQKYFELVLEDAHQDFYDFKRTYEFINKIFDDRGDNKQRKSLPELYFTQEEFGKKLSDIKKKIKAMAELTEEDRIKKEKFRKFYRNFTENEKQIRLNKVTDMLSLLMGRELLFSESPTAESEIGVKEQIKLKEYKNLLSKRIDYKHNYKKNGKATGHKIQAKIKIKNYGDFISFIHDNRLETLFKQIPQKSYQKEILDKELENYELRRVEVFKLIHKLENLTYHRCKSELKFNDDGYIKFKQYKNVLEKLFGGEESKEKLKKIEAIRNKFSHNQYPSIELIVTDGIRTEIREIANFMYENIKESVEYFTNRLAE